MFVFFGCCVLWSGRGFCEVLPSVVCLGMISKRQQRGDLDPLGLSSHKNSLSESLAAIQMLLMRFRQTNYKEVDMILVDVQTCKLPARCQ